MYKKNKQKKTAWWVCATVENLLKPGLVWSVTSISFYQVSSGDSHQALDSSRTTRWSSGSMLSDQDTPTYLHIQLKSEQTHDQRLFRTIIFTNTSYQ